MDTNFVAHDEAAGFRHAMPGETEFLAVDLAAYGDTGAGIAPGILDDTSELRVQLHILRDAMDGQVAIYFIGAVVIHVLIFGIHEFYCRELRRIEEIG